MSFEAFLERVASRLDPVDSSGASAAAGDGITHAAVMIFLRRAPDEAEKSIAGAQAEILFIKRAERKGDPWSGHLAFPGGRAEARDATLLDIALREAAEEVGIDARKGGRVLGRLPTLHPMSVHLPSIDVTPFVALAPAWIVLRPQKDEVDEAFWMPLAILKNGRSTRVRFEIRGEAREWPAYPSPKGPIWGITERILTGFIAVVE